MGFKDEYSVESRRAQSKEVLDKFYPYKVPVVIQKYSREKNLIPFKRRKYLIPSSMKYSALMIVLREKLLKDFSPSIAIFLSTADGNLLCNSDNILHVHQQHHDREDGFLYLYYCCENTFG